MKLDRILELLVDFQWHSVEELKKEMSMQDEKLNELLLFLEEQFLISKQNKKVRITPKGLKFLELPS